MAFPVINPFFQFFDDTGEPLASGTVETYESGTNTPKVTYQEATLTTPNATTIDLDAAGRCSMFVDDGESFKYIVKDADGVTVDTQDGVKSPVGTQAGIGALLYPRTAAEIAAGVTPDNLAVPNDVTGMAFEARYSSREDFVDVTNEATLGAIAAASFSEVGQPYAVDIATFYAKHDISVHGYYGFLDESVINYAGGAPIYGHASFDDNVTFTGSVASDHHHSFQSYPHYSASATISRIAGFYSIGDVTAGTVSHYAGLHVDDPTGAGTITNLYGVYINELDRGSGNSYAFFSEGQTKSCLGGDLQLGNPVTPATVKYDYDSGNLELIPRTGGYKTHVRSELLIGTGDEAQTASIENTGSGDLEITARTGFVTKMKSPTQVEHPMKLPAYTVAELGSAVLPGDWTDCICICSNESGGRTLVFSTGTNWKRVSDLANIS